MIQKVGFENAFLHGCCHEVTYLQRNDTLYFPTSCTFHRGCKEIGGSVCQVACCVVLVC